ncbi:hypothetical protein ACFOET_06300 [Parapedobacter deserti]|uniref:Uncharacterized protein n=1 Tax=Parapedobacter deserti TaxID=1912957 RepID=A0ABV7JK90_9SPHI
MINRPSNDNVRTAAAILRIVQDARASAQAWHRCATSPDATAMGLMLPISSPFLFLYG